jgi:D-arabinan exo alpha-(1,3)/(1,5)-arabinofuranosidase (non-reducing end)
MFNRRMVLAALAKATASLSANAKEVQAPRPKQYPILASCHDAACVDTSLDSRSISFENVTGERGRGGTAAGRRKGAPARTLGPSEKITLCDIKGPGRVRHIWMTFRPAEPEAMRSIFLEAFYDDLEAPSISVPCLDFFGLPHGRAVPYSSALTSVAECRGFNSYFPMPFGKRLRIEVTNGGAAATPFFYQIDYTLQEAEPNAGYLHVSFRRENPTTIKRDFVIAGGLKGPGRFLGSSVGIRIFHDDMSWYGEGKFKVYRDGDEKFPTICGTGLEDYVGSAWGMGKHTAPYSGVPIHVAPPAPTNQIAEVVPDFVSFYRWHLPDPIIFQETLTATIQQIGFLSIPRGQESRIPELEKKYTLAGEGWRRNIEGTPFSAFASAEQKDDYCASAFVYCLVPQPVPRLDVKTAVADIGLQNYETPSTES